MIIDYISDIHEDYQNLKLNKEDVGKFINKLSPKGEILLIAGDISEDNDRLLNFLKLILVISNYKKIYFVLGNHELYGLRYKSYKEKVKELKLFLKLEEDIILLDGNIEEYNGVKIGGCMMWYDGSYSKYIDEKKNLNELWNDFMPDSVRINGLDYYKDILFEEKKKLNKIYKECDILLTHISPLCNPKYVISMFKNDLTSSFYYFDGKKYIKYTSAKHWIFGHIHSRLEVNYNDIYFHCNPYGYKQGAERKRFKQIII